MRSVQELQDHDPREVGPYRVLGLLGAGGMGQVYLAAGDAGPVAVKIVHPWLADDQEFRVRFAREVTASRAVRSPWTAAVVDADVDATVPWLATEYIPGVALDAAVRSAGPLPATTVHVLAADMARALAAIHAAGLVHRDIKPGNVLVGGERPYLLDFGISRALDATQLTGTGAAVGTPAYMSPEQAEGLPTGPASDLFSLAAVLVFAATGVGPFGEGTPVALLRRILVDEPDLGDLADPVRSATARCLQRDPDARPTAAELVDLLQPLPAIPRNGWLPAALTVLVPHPPAVPAAPPPPAPEPPVPPWVPAAQPPVRRFSRRDLLIGAGALGVLGGGAAVGIALGGREPAGGSAAPAAPPTAPPAGEPVVRWTFPAAGEVRGMTFDDGTLYASSVGAEVYAIDPASGQARWTYTLDGPMFEPPRVGDGVVAVHDSDALYALDASTGRTRWSADYADALAAGSGIVLASVFDSTSASSYVLTAFDAATGTPRWTYPIPDSDLPFTVLPVFDGGRVHIGLDRSLVTLDTATGTVQRQLVAEASIDELGIAGDVLIYRPSNGYATGETFVAIEATSGASRWRRSTDYGIVFPGTVDNGVLFLEPAASLEAWDAATGEPRWAIDQFQGDQIEWSMDTSRIAAADGICYVGGAEIVYGPDGHLVNGPNGRSLTEYSLFAFSADSGELRWRLPIAPGPGLGAPLVAVPGTVFLGGTTAAIHAVSEV